MIDLNAGIPYWLKNERAHPDQTTLQIIRRKSIWLEELLSRGIADDAPVPVTTPTGSLLYDHARNTSCAVHFD